MSLCSDGNGRDPASFRLEHAALCIPGGLKLRLEPTALGGLGPALRDEPFREIATTRGAPGNPDIGLAAGKAALY